MAKIEALDSSRTCRRASCLYCARCQFLLPIEGYFVHCLGCNSYYHFECSGLQKEAYAAKSESERRSWRCTPCRVKCNRCRATMNKPYPYTSMSRIIGKSVGTTMETGSNQGFAMLPINKPN